MDKEKCSCQEIEEPLIEEAIALRHKGEYVKALAMLESIHERCSDIAVVCLFIGDVLVRLDRVEESIPFHRECVLLRPDLAIASLCLYKALWKFGSYDEAFEEAVRFDSQSQHPTYVELLNKYNQLGFKDLDLKVETIQIVREQIAKYSDGYQYPWNDNINKEGSTG